MRIRTVLISAAVTMALAAGAEAGSRLRGVTRIHPVNDQAAALLTDARQQSATVRNLIKQLEEGNVVAFVQVVSPEADGPQSTMRFMGASSLTRHVLIQVAECQAPCRRVELLAHELQHANEVAEATWVADNLDLRRLLMARGYRDSDSARGYETVTAQLTERAVRREIRALSRPAQ